MRKKETRLENIFIRVRKKHAKGGGTVAWKLIIFLPLIQGKGQRFNNKTKRKEKN